MSYAPPNDLAIWKKDNPGEELYVAAIHDDRKVMLAYGRYSHSSGSKTVSWEQFLSGEMQSLVSSMMGGKVLSEMLEKLKELNG